MTFSAGIWLLLFFLLLKHRPAKLQDVGDVRDLFMSSSFLFMCMDFLLSGAMIKGWIEGFMHAIREECHGKVA